MGLCRGLSDVMSVCKVIAFINGRLGEVEFDRDSGNFDTTALLNLYIQIPVPRWTL
jgi:hypothetical protein